MSETNAPERAGREVEHSAWLDVAVRIGMVTYGIVHLLIGWLALQLAFGDRSENASSKGAMQELAKQPFGDVLVWAIAVGMFLLVIWRLIETFFGHWDKQGGDLWKARFVSAGKAVIYGVVGVIAAKTALGAQSGGGKPWTSEVMSWPAGQWIVAAVGLVVVGYGANHVRRGFTEEYAKHLDAEGRTGEAGRVYLFFGKFGYIAKGLAIAIVGGLILYGGITHDPDKSGSLDQALHKLLTYPFGQWLLVVIAAGLASYGLFCFARARHLNR
jgi:hypothetical protein